MLDHNLADFPHHSPLTFWNSGFKCALHINFSSYGSTKTSHLEDEEAPPSHRTALARP
jgi:hypothetical protein